jgi:hypothetical protein
MIFQIATFNFLSNNSLSTESLTQSKGSTFCWGGEYKDDFSSRETLYVDPGVSEAYIPELSNESKNYPFLMLGNTCSSLTN